MNTIQPDARIASAPLAALSARPLPQSELERTATEFLKEWVRHVEAVSAQESKEYAEALINAMRQIRELARG
jgi:hypothetical protein